MRFRNHTVLHGLLCAGLFFAGCSGQMVKSFADLAAFRQALVEEYKEQNVNVVIQNARTLGITFVNTSFNRLDETARARKAQEVALFAKNRYPSAGNIGNIWVSFASQESYFFVFHYNQVLATYLFDIRGRPVRSGPPAPEPTVEGLKAGAVFSERQNETTVMVSMPLQGDPYTGHGLLLVSAFTVPGRELAAPRWVEFKFSSYSDREEFARSRRLSVYVDKKKVVSGEARLLSPGEGGADATVAEFVTYSMPYGQFLRVVEGEAVELELGERRISLTGEHLQALRGLKECVDAKRCRS